MPFGSHLGHKHKVFPQYEFVSVQSVHFFEWKFYSSLPSCIGRVGCYYVFGSVCQDPICDWKPAWLFVSVWSPAICEIRIQITFPQCSHEQLKARLLSGVMPAPAYAKCSNCRNCYFELQGKRKSMEGQVCIHLTVCFGEREWEYSSVNATNLSSRVMLDGIL